MIEAILLVLLKVTGYILIYLGGVALWFYIIVIATLPVSLPIVLLLRKRGGLDDRRSLL